jgi:hypothetical protein
MDTNITTNTATVPLVPAVDVIPAKQVSKVIINRCIADTTSKCDMLMRDLQIPGITIVNYYKASGRRKRLNFSLSMSLMTECANTIVSGFTTQLTRDDNTLSHLKDGILSIETQYAGYLKHFGLEYRRNTYHDGFNTLSELLSEESLARMLSNAKLKPLIETIKKYQVEFSNRYQSIQRKIEDEARRLNTTNQHDSKKTRVRKLLEFSEYLVVELIDYREEYRKNVLEEYEKCKQERIISASHEDYGPTAML